MRRRVGEQNNNPPKTYSVAPTRRRNSDPRRNSAGLPRRVETQNKKPSLELFNKTFRCSTKRRPLLNKAASVIHPLFNKAAAVAQQSGVRYSTKLSAAQQSVRLLNKKAPPPVSHRIKTPQNSKPRPKGFLCAYSVHRPPQWPPETPRNRIKTQQNKKPLPEGF